MAQGIRRVVTGHNIDGKAVGRIEGVGANRGSGRANHASQVIWTSNDIPVGFAEDGEDKSARGIGTTIHGGSVFRVVEYGPGVVPRNHRTDGIDYAMVISGKIDTTRPYVAKSARRNFVLGHFVNRRHSNPCK